MSDQQRHPDDEPAEDWPPPLVEGEPQQLPGMEDVAVRPAEGRGYPN